MTAPPPAAARTRSIPIDPRIRARRVAVRREEGRRRLRLLVGSAVTVALVVAAVGATRSPLLDVDTVEVTGASETDPAAVIAAAGLGHRRQLLDVDLAAVRAAVGALPWIATVVAERSWPGTVRIAVTEREPVAFLPGHEGLVALVDETGRVLAVTTEGRPGAPAISVPPADYEPGQLVGDDLTAALAVAAALPTELEPEVRHLEIRVDGVAIVLEGGLTVRMGPATELGEKLLALATVLTRARPARGTVIDVRVPGAPVLTREP